MLPPPNGSLYTREEIRDWLRHDEWPAHYVGSLVLADKAAKDQDRGLDQPQHAHPRKSHLAGPLQAEPLVGSYPSPN